MPTAVRREGRVFDADRVQCRAGDALETGGTDLRLEKQSGNLLTFGPVRTRVQADCGDHSIAE
jgi:hypothetical protein